jgi:class 3 adenylate cyclase
MPAMVNALDNDRLAARPATGQAAQRRAVTVLSVDIVGSMSLCSAMSDECWWLVIDELFTILSDGVQRFGGWVENFAGDGMVAVFGTEADEGRQALRACTAALWIRDAAERYAAELERRAGVELSVRLGINSGDAVIGALGNSPTPRVVAIGHAVGLAKRIETLAEPGSVYIGQATAALLDDALDVSALGTFDVRGAGHPVRLFELLGPGAPATVDGGRAEPRQLVAVAAGHALFVFGE